MLVQATTASIRALPAKRIADRIQRAPSSDLARSIHDPKKPPPKKPSPRSGGWISVTLGGRREVLGREGNAGGGDVIGVRGGFVEHMLCSNAPITPPLRWKRVESSLAPAFSLSAT
jgi:hypothetical protein